MTQHSFAAEVTSQTPGDSAAPATASRAPEHSTAPATASKGFVAGTHRLCDPRATLERVLPCSALLGITRVADITGLDQLGIPVAAAYRPNSRSLVTALGKGITLEHAKVSALMEAVESFHAERIALPLRYASYRELSANEVVVNPELLPRTRHSRFHVEAQLLWVQAWDIMGERGNETCWVPFETVHTNFTLPLPPGTGCFLMSSNGLAAGNHVLEAISHGLCEVVERHANALWHVEPAANQRKRRIDLRTVESAACRDVLRRFAQANVAVAAWDITSDVAIPTILVEAVDERDDPGRLLYATSGLGCHPAPEIALLRALTEAAQCRLAFISGARDDSDRDIYEQARNRTVIDQARRKLASDEGVVSFASLRDHSSPTFEGDLNMELTALQDAGIFSVLVAELTQPAFGIPVVRVLVPDLEGIFDVPGYVPGRRARARLQELAR